MAFNLGCLMATARLTCLMLLVLLSPTTTATGVSAGFMGMGSLLHLDTEALQHSGSVALVLLVQ